MPVLRETPPKAKTPLQLAADRELGDMFARLERSVPWATERARIVALVQLDRDLEPDEQAEFDRLVKRHHRREARERSWSLRLDAAIDERQRKHPDETRGESALAVVLKRSDKRREREARRDERRAAAERVFEQERAGAAAQVAHEAGSAPAAPSPSPAPYEPVEATQPLEPAPRRPRLKVGIVAQYDAAGRRVE